MDELIAKRAGTGRGHPLRRAGGLNELHGERERDGKVAILGIGTVGGGTAEVLTKNRELIAEEAGQEIELKYILCRRARPDYPFAHFIVHDIDTVVNDPEIKVVAECIGGATLAYEYDRRCLEAGKNVVTSNKELVAEKGPGADGPRPEKGREFLFEASVGGGIPILRPICQCPLRPTR